MKTLIDISKISDLNCGLGQFAYYLQKELYKLDPNLIFYADESSCDQVCGKFKVKKKWHRNKYLFRPQIDIWHGIHQDCDVYPMKKSIKRILTIQDLNFINESDDESRKKKYLKSIQNKIDRSVALTFISEFTKLEVEKHLNTTGKRTQIISNGICVNEQAQGELSPKVSELVMRLGGDFIFGIGTVVPKKNYKLAISMAVQNPHLRFVIAGTTFHTYAKEMQEEIKKRGVQDRVNLIGEITEVDKVYLYKKSCAFFHPSFLEGFGLPVIEAMYLGLPVICSNSTSLPEVTGGLAYLFDPHCTDGALQAVELCLKDLKENKINFLDLRSHAAQYSWEKAAKQYYELYHSIGH